MPPILGQPRARESSGRRLWDAGRTLEYRLLFSFQGPSDRFFEMLLVEASEGIRVPGPIAQLV